MHQTSTGTTKKKKQNFQQLLRSGPIVPGIVVLFFGLFGTCAGLVHLVVCFFSFFWCLCRFGDSDFTKHWQAPIPLDAPNIDRHQKKKNPATTQKCTHSSWIFFVFFCACAGLVHLVVCFLSFLGACAGLVTLTSQHIDKQHKQSRNTANISSNLLSLLLHVLLISPWWISTAAASWLQARSYIFGFQKPLQ